MSWRLLWWSSSSSTCEIKRCAGMCRWYKCVRVSVCLCGERERRERVCVRVSVCLCAERERRESVCERGGRDGGWIEQSSCVRISHCNLHIITFLSLSVSLPSPLRLPPSLPLRLSFPSLSLSLSLSLLHSLSLSLRLSLRLSLSFSPSLSLSLRLPLTLSLSLSWCGLTGTRRDPARFEPNFQCLGSPVCVSTSLKVG
jgi:hypothetical protein